MLYQTTSVNCVRWCHSSDAKLKEIQTWSYAGDYNDKESCENAGKSLKSLNKDNNYICFIKGKNK